MISYPSEEESIYQDSDIEQQHQSVDEKYDWISVYKPSAKKKAKSKKPFEDKKDKLLDRLIHKFDQKVKDIHYSHVTLKIEFLQKIID